MVNCVPWMCVVWWASSSSARWLMRRTHSSDSVAASRNPRARSIAVNPAVMAFVIVKRGAKLLTSQLASEGAVLEGGEERVQLGERGAVASPQVLHGGKAAGKVTLEGKGWDRIGHRLDDAHVQASHYGPLGRLIEIPPSERMLEEVGVEECRQAFLRLQCDATEVLRVDGKRDLVRNNRTPSAGAHDCDENIARPDGVPLQFPVLRLGNESPF